MGAFTEFIKASSNILPEVPKPIRRPGLNERLIWTGIALTIYLVMAQVPLYGVPIGPQDPLAFTRIIFASSAGTLMELGIGPIVTAGLILQLLKGADILKLDFSKPEDRALFTSATKLLTYIIIIVQASAYILGGAYGPNLPASTMVIILFQLFMATVIVTLLDELVQKGWGIGSGVSLFILAGVAQRIVWDVLSPLETGEGPFGIIPYTIVAGLQGNLPSALFRSGGLPSLFGLAMTIAIILAIIYIEGMRVEVPITSIRFRGFAGVYPIKLMYVSNVPVILVSALLANVTFFSQMLWARVNPATNPWIKWIADFDPQNPGRGPIGGLIYYITSPGGITGSISEPVRALTYLLFLVVFSTLFAKIWVEMGGLSPKAVAKSLIDAKVQVRGYRRAEASIEALLSRYIPVITIISGMLIGLIAGVSDILGAFGTGTGILLMVDIVLNYYQMLAREHIEEFMPRVGAFLGRT
jgi:preprotein translocase SecY subunit